VLFRDARAEWYVTWLPGVDPLPGSHIHYDGMANRAITPQLHAQRPGFASFSTFPTVS
jgi:hypothetical protein